MSAFFTFLRLNIEFRNDKIVDEKKFIFNSSYLRPFVFKVFFMKADVVKRNEKIVKLLTKAGINEKLARIVVFLSTVPEAVSRAIEREANLRQPEVSLAMKELKAMGWTDEEQVRTKGKGRPFKVYRLKRPLKEVVGEVVERKRRELETIKRKLEELEEQVGLIK
jgi:predicted transcriptional regulator